MISIQSPAKINWFLKVLGKRADGYHNIYSVMQRIALSDTLSFEETEGEIVIESDLEIAMEENLVYKAAALMKKHSSCSSGVRIKLVKKIPLQAGLGGGSSNAATTLSALNRLWKADLNLRTLTELGARLGSDVPFFLNSPLAVVEGRGEVITPLQTSTREIALLIVKPEHGISTARAYAEVAAYSEMDRSQQTLLVEILRNGPVDRLPEVICNDFEEPAYRLYPELGNIRDRLLNQGAIAALLCGSGSSIFGVFANREGAEEASRSFEDRWHVVTETVSHK
ncbi:4-diphosphocytidyl-2-C-methyl-D-erythritol kinase [hydrothermal vent metagenome]|uniref:4-(cytidine 5'-diphospho)-2-C-methyl-D-erythritol kinase n=1 Tax=hydrothermal vent metagenome TaxID=652676 RepID=A0A3B1CR47_9ZZZZ